MSKRSIFFLPAILASVAISFAAQANATQFDDEAYFTVDSVEFEEVADSDAIALSDSVSDVLMNEENVCTSEDDPMSSLDEVDVALDKIINIGRKIWTIVEKNRPVVKVTMNSANAVPDGIRSWQELEGWQVPQVRAYSTVYKNLFGMTVVRFVYRVIYSYGGTFKGQGKYLTNVTVIPAEVHVAWGYKFDAEAQVTSVLNTGSSRNPVAAMELGVAWTVSTPVRHMHSSRGYFMTGHGDFTSLK